MIPMPHAAGPPEAEACRSAVVHSAPPAGLLGARLSNNHDSRLCLESPVLQTSCFVEVAVEGRPCRTVPANMFGARPSSRRPSKVDNSLGSAAWRMSEHRKTKRQPISNGSAVRQTSEHRKNTRPASPNGSIGSAIAKVWVQTIRINEFMTCS